MKTVNEMRKRTKLQVAKNAAKEYEEFIKAAMEHNMVLLEEMVKEDGRKRIAKRDVVRLFSKRYVRTADDDPK
jgi:histone H3/H4